MTLTGWGRQKYAVLRTEKSLWEAHVGIYSHSYCNFTYNVQGGHIGTIIQNALPRLFQSNLMCAGYEVIHNNRTLKKITGPGVLDLGQIARWQHLDHDFRWRPFRDKCPITTAARVFCRCRGRIRTPAAVFGAAAKRLKIELKSFF